jgi:hypothetical protein
MCSVSAATTQYLRHIGNSCHRCSESSAHYASIETTHTAALAGRTHHTHIYIYSSNFTSITLVKSIRVKQWRREHCIIERRVTGEYLSRAPHGLVAHSSQKSTTKPSEDPKPKKKTQAELDQELQEKLRGLSGDGGDSGVEYEDGKPVSMKRSVKNNMFRYI